jgi:(2Fe-2S) ferredoxin
MNQLSQMTSHSQQRPTGQVLKGQYRGVYRSEKGKIKGLILRIDTQEIAVKLPKYLRPLLVRELLPETFVQVWAYQDDGVWRGINLMPLTPQEVAKLVATWEISPPETQPNSLASNRVCLQVCRKGKCYKSGGLEILQQLQATVQANPDWQHIQVESVGCMNACKQGPNVRLTHTGQILHRVTPGTAKAILGQLQKQTR